MPISLDGVQQEPTSALPLTTATDSRLLLIGADSSSRVRKEEARFPRPRQLMRGPEPSGILPSSQPGASPGGRRCLGTAGPWIWEQRGGDRSAAPQRLGSHSPKVWGAPGGVELSRGLGTMQLPAQGRNERAIVPRMQWSQTGPPRGASAAFPGRIPLLQHEGGGPGAATGLAHDAWVRCTCPNRHSLPQHPAFLLTSRNSALTEGFSSFHLKLEQQLAAGTCPAASAPCHPPRLPRSQCLLLRLLGLHRGSQPQISWSSIGKRGSNSLKAAAAPRVQDCPGGPMVPGHPPAPTHAPRPPECISPPMELGTAPGPSLHAPSDAGEHRCQPSLAMGSSLWHPPWRSPARHQTLRHQHYPTALRKR